MNQFQIILAAAATGAVALLGGLVWGWLASRRREQNWREAWQILEQNPTKALLLLDRFAPRKKRKPPQGAKPREKYAHACWGQAVCLVRLAQLSEAEAATTHAASVRSANASELALLAKAWLATPVDGRPTSAYDQLARYLALSETQTNPELRQQADAALRAALVGAPTDSPERSEQLVALARLLVERLPQAVWAWRALGLTLVRQTKWADAIDPLKQALALQDPEPVELYQTLAAAYRETGDKPQALAAALSGHQAAPSPFSAFHTAQFAFQLLPSGPPAPDESTLVNSALTAAHELLESATKDDPHFADAWMLRSRVAWRRKDVTGAVTSAEKAATLDPKRADAPAALGDYCLARGDKVRARQFLERARQLDPDHPGVDRALGDLAHSEGRFGDAVTSYSRLVERKLADDGVLDRLARCYLETNQPARVLQTLAGRTNLSPAPRLVLARAQGRLSRWSDALKTFEEPPLAQPAAEWRYYWGAALAANGKLKEGAAHFNTLLNDPTWGLRSRRQLGHVKALSGDFADAEKLYSALNGQPVAPFDLGRLALLRNDPDAAQKQFNQMKDAAANPVTRFATAVADSRLGKPEALESLAADPRWGLDAAELLANQAFEEQRYLDALGGFERVIKERKAASTRVLARLAAAYLFFHRDRDALPHLVELVRRVPNNKSFKSNLALCRFRIGRQRFKKHEWEAARREFRQGREAALGVQPELAKLILIWELEAMFREVVRALEEPDQSALLKKACDLSQEARKLAPEDFRWAFTAGMALALADDFKHAVEHSRKARQLDPNHFHNLLALGLNEDRAGNGKQAQEALAALVKLTEKSEAEDSVLAVTARFALAMSHARDQHWADAAHSLEPLLTHRLVTSSKKLNAAELAQIAVAHYAAAGQMDKARTLTEKHLPNSKVLTDILVGIVKADSGDFAGAASVLSEAFVRDKNPKVGELLVNCLLAVAGKAVMDKQAPGAQAALEKALRLFPHHAGATQLQEALAFAANLQKLDVAQLDDALTRCRQSFDRGDRSAELVRSLGLLYHRKAVQAEQKMGSPDATWQTCIQFWRAEILGSSTFFPQFVRSYNTGKKGREQLKDEDVAEFRGALASQMADIHLQFVKHFTQRSFGPQLRHLKLIWEWMPEREISKEALLEVLNVADTTDDQITQLETLARSIRNEGAKKGLLSAVGVCWSNKGVDMCNRGIRHWNDSSGPSGFRAARATLREGVALIKKAMDLAPWESNFRENYNKAKKELDSVERQCSQGGIY